MHAPISPETPIRVVIVGGGTSGWMTAAALTRHLGRLIELTLIESEEIGIVGVGEATLPHLRHFIENLGLDESEFMASTSATYKLGIQFENFGAIGDSYIHPFGTFGQERAGVPFHHFWLRSNGGRGDIGDYSLGVVAARMNRFRLPRADDLSLASSFGYAYQFDATRFGPYLRKKSTEWGARRIEGKVVDVELGANGIDALKMENGSSIEGDLFIDCSGFRALLIGKALSAPWEDWSHWLPCDRAAALPCSMSSADIEPYTRAIAMSAGWRWRIPLQHRIGNGYVFSSQHLSEDEACATMLATIEGEPLADPRVIRFQAGRRKESWIGNVVAIGLSSGFLEPLESTSIYLVQMAIARLIDYFPIGGIFQADRDEFNRLVDMEYDRIRDFLILHYNATRRTDSSFWNHVRTMEVPETLSAKLELWKRTGRISQYSQGLFFEPSWVAVYLGQGVIPEHFDARASIPPIEDVRKAMDVLKSEIECMVCDMPKHQDALPVKAREAIDA